MTEPIRAEDLVGTVLARDESLVDVFERHSPHFLKLRNPVMRRTMARLVTVAQAAGVAGVPVEALLHDLNVALGTTPPTPAMPSGRTGAVGSAIRPPGLREFSVDLREDLRQGREPFPRIMAAVAGLATDEVLHLRTIFEPVPLYAVMRKRGFAHEVRRDADEDWSVWFWRAEAQAPDAPTEPVGDDGAPAPDEQWLDVRGLEPPEPMLRTLAALEALPQDHTLVQVNVRVPQFLLPILAERGLAFDVDETRPDRVLVRIRRRA